MARPIGNCRSVLINQIQRFAGVLNQDGELVVTGTNLLSLTPSAIYASQPNDGNSQLYIEVISNTEAIIKNTVEILNSGVSVKGKFE